VKTKVIKRLKKKNSLVKTWPEAKAMNTVFLDLRTSIEDCVAIIKAFKKLGYTTYYDSKTKTLKTTAPKTKIKEFSRLFKCIQSYSLMQKLK
jgi:hypothetical protein